MILLVEHDSALADTCYLLLSIHGYVVSIATDAVDALKQMSWHTPQLVITDWRLPCMDGMALLRQMRGQQNWAHVPSILMSGLIPSRHEPDRPYDVFIQKPFLAEQLTEAVQLLLRVPRRPRSNEQHA